MARAFHCLGKDSGDGKSMGPVVWLHHRFLAWNMVVPAASGSAVVNYTMAGPVGFVPELKGKGWL